MNEQRSFENSKNRDEKYWQKNVVSHHTTRKTEKTTEAQKNTLKIDGQC